MSNTVERLKAALADRYTIEHELGAGGMATVYLAHDLRHDRKVAVKVLRPDLAATLGSDRFHREIKIVAQLHHPHILPLYDSGEAGGFLYYVMPYEEGQSLRDKLAKEGELPITEAIRLLRDVVDALAHAHQHGVVHRDIKPENIMLSGHHALVTDFGVAKAVSEATGRHQLTTAGVALGTPAYMAPEQAAADPHIDHRADIYAVGALAYEILTGRPPFTGRTPQMVLAAHVTEAPEPVMKHREAVHPALAQLVMKCLAKKPADRWQSAQELLAQLEAQATPSGGSEPTSATPLAQRGTVQSRPAAAAEKSIAVLPFANMSADPENEYFSDGITEEIINALAQIPELHVAARTSSFVFKGKSEDLRVIGEQLNVRTVLEGSVRKAGNRLRITAQLVNAEDGYHLWSERYDREMEDVFAIQDEIATTIVETLKVKLIGTSDGDTASGTRDTEAYDLYLKGRYHWNKRTKEGLTTAVRYFTQAVEHDAAFARAYAGLADSYLLLGPPGVVAQSAHDIMPRAKAAAKQALEIDDSLAEARTSLAFALLVYEWEWEQSEREFRRALASAPRYATAHQWFAVNLTCVGRFEEAIHEIDEALAIDPLSLIINRNAGLVRYYARQYPEALDRLNATLALEPDFVPALLAVGLVFEETGDPTRAVSSLERATDISGRTTVTLAALGRALAADTQTDRARTVIDELETRRSGEYVPPYYVARIHAKLGDADRAFASLETAYRERSGYFAYLNVDPKMDELRGDPRFHDLVRRLRLPGIDP